MKKMVNDPNFKEQYIQDYLKVSGGLDAQLKAAQAANNQKEVNALTAYKSGVDNAFANSGAADCETLQNLYAAKIEENKDNLPLFERDYILVEKNRLPRNRGLLWHQTMLIVKNLVPRLLLG